MSDQPAPPPVSPAPGPAPQAAPELAPTQPETFDGARSAAASYLARVRWEKAREAAQTPAAPEPTPEEPAAAQPQETDHASPAAEPPVGEDAPREPEAEAPPIVPPRSWTQEAKERFASLPRETQEYIADRERDRERTISRSQQEAADAKRSIETERQAVAQAKQQYEQAIAQALQMAQATDGEFSDIKSHADVEKLASEDPFRYARWAARQQKMTLLAQEAQAAEQRKRTESDAQLNEWRARQDKAFTERVPELADSTKREKLQKDALETLKEVGFSQEEMTHLYNNSILRDARVQELILKATKYDQGQKAVKAAATKPALPLQRPGVSQPPVNRDAQRYETLGKELESATGSKALRIAAEMHQLRMKAGKK